MFPRVWYMATSWAEAWLYSLVRIRDSGRRTGREGQWAYPGLPLSLLTLESAVQLVYVLTPHLDQKLFFSNKVQMNSNAVDTYLGLASVFICTLFSTAHFLLCISKVPCYDTNMIIFLYVLSSQFFPNTRLWSPWRKRLDFSSSFLSRP